MKKVLSAITTLALATLLIPEEASAQRRGSAGIGGFQTGGAAFRGGGVVGMRRGFDSFSPRVGGYRPAMAGYGYRGAYRSALGGYGYRGVAYPARRLAYGAGYRPYYRGDRGSYGYGAAIGVGVIGAAMLGSLGYYGSPYDAGYAYSNPYGYPGQGGVVYEAYPAGLSQPCSPGPGCRADGYPDARYYGRAYDR